MGSCVGIGRKTIHNSTVNGRIFIHEGQLMDRLTEQQVKILKNHYNKSKSSGQGLDRKGMLALFQGLKTFHSSIVTKCFNIFSKESNFIEFRYFCIVIAKICLSSKEDQADFVFDLFDCDCDNKLKEPEIDLLLRTQEQHLRKISQNPTENFKLLKEKFKELPVGREDFVGWALRNIELSDLLKPFEVIPSGSTENIKVQKKMMAFTKKVGDFVYLISQEWWVAWKFYVRYQDDNNEDFEISSSMVPPIEPANRVKPFALGDRPIEIHNSNLLQDSNRLKKGLRENFEYTIVSEEVWDLLLSWYGGGPTICRQVCQEKNLVFVDLYPLIFPTTPIDELGNLQQEKKKVIFINNKAKVKDLLQQACLAFEKPPILSRILYFSNGNWDFLINPESKVMPLLADGCDLLLETGYTEKNCVIWPTERKEKMKNATETNSNDTANTNELKKVEKLPQKSSNAAIPGISGLGNLGNTCYLNSVLQALLHTPMLEKFFISDLVSAYLNSKIKPENSLSIDLNQLAKEMYLSKTSKVIPKNFHKKLVKRFPMFDGNYQHDAHECLSLILNTVHEELSRFGEEVVSDICSLENPEDRKIEIEKADEQWKALQGNKGSLVSDVCGGQTRRTLTCVNCGNRRVLFEIFNNLSIPVPACMEICIHATVVYKHKKALQVGVFISKFLRVGDLMQEISNLAEIPKEKLIIAFYYPGSPVFPIKNCEGDPIFRRIRENTNLLVFEASTTLEEAESIGKRWSAYGSNTNFLLPNQQVDVKVGNDWKSGKITISEGKNFIVDLDYEDKLEILSPDCIFPYRAYTKFENPKILHIPVYHQILRNGKIECIGFPNFISIGNWYTYKDISEYATSLIKSCINNPSNSGFALKAIENSTLKCAICKKCDGCPLPNDKNDLKMFETQSIAVLWEDGGFFQDISVHESVAEVERKGKKEPIDIGMCLNSFTKPENVDLECEKCHHKEQKTQVDIWRVPDILVICLVRFAYQNGNLDKIDQAVYIPFYAFDISQWVKGVEISGGMTLSTTSLQNAYDLYSVILHSGSVEAGHYTTLVKVNQNDDSIWVHLDDPNVNIMKEDIESQQVMQNAYMLFYKRRKLSSSNVITLISNYA